VSSKSQFSNLAEELGRVKAELEAAKREKQESQAKLTRSVF
jgi:hypothetical protein